MLFLRLPFREQVGDPQRRAIHGGVLSTVLDVAGGTVCWAAMMSLGARVSTVDFGSIIFERDSVKNYVVKPIDQTR